MPSELSDVIIAQVQGFHRNQLSGPPAVYTADLIMMSGKKKKKKKLHKMPHKRALGVVEDHTHRPITLPYKVSTSLFLKI